LHLLKILETAHISHPCSKRATFTQCNAAEECGDGPEDEALGFLGVYERRHDFRGRYVF